MLIHVVWLGITFQSEATLATNTIKSKPFQCTNDVESSHSSDDDEQIVYPRRLKGGSYSNDEPVCQFATDPFADKSKLHSLKTFNSLLQMMRNMQSDDPQFAEMEQFIEQRVESGDCSLRDISVKYPKRFLLNEKGDLSQIRFGHFRLREHFDLSTIPNTVTTMFLCQNQLTSIGDLSGLRGSSLRFLDVKRNLNLNLNLSALEDKRDPSSLEMLSVSPIQIAKYLRVHQMRSDEWIQTSSLKQLRIVTGSCKVLRFYPASIAPTLIESDIIDDSDSKQQPVQTQVPYNGALWKNIGSAFKCKKCSWELKMQSPALMTQSMKNHLEYWCKGMNRSQ